jgi:hypothetical protein
MLLDRLPVFLVKRVILVGVVGNISACHADARGSIPRRGAFWLNFEVFYLFSYITQMYHYHSLIPW